MLNNEQKHLVQTMPPLAHYPDRTKPFNFRDSHVIQFLEAELYLTHEEAVKAFESVRRSKWILFDSNTKMWMGCELYKEKYQEEGYAK